MATTPVTVWSQAYLVPVYRPRLALQESVLLAPNLVLPAGQVLGEIAASPGTFAPYLAANTDGTQNPKCILTYPATTDGAGAITLGDDTGTTYTRAPAYFAGYFKSEELTGMDAAGLTKMGGKLISGTLTAGILHI